MNITTKELGLAQSRELLVSVTKKDLDITWYSGSGAGGQHRNKHPNCCRIKHRDSGTLVTAGEQRSRDQNLKTAFKRLTENDTFKNWLKLASARAMVDKKEVEKAIQKKVAEEMKEENLKFEYFDPEEKNGN